MAPRSMLIVCVGNTCRSPMAEALAKRMWPEFNIRSAGTNVRQEGKGAAEEAITVMSSINGCDIQEHKTKSLSKLDITHYEYFVALDKTVKRELVEVHSIDPPKIIDLFIKDPIGNDLALYRKCAKEIKSKLEKLQLS